MKLSQYMQIYRFKNIDFGGGGGGGGGDGTNLK